MAEKKVSRFFFWLFSLITVAVLAALALSEFWPQVYWWIPNSFFIGPLWAGVVVLFFLILMAFWVRSIKGVYLHSLLLLWFVYFFMGFNIPRDKPLPLYGETVTLRLMTVNVGEGMSGSALYGYITRMRPDIIFLQEMHGDVVGYLYEKFATDGWEHITARGLSIASRFPVLDKQIPEHYLLGTTLDGPAGPLRVYSLHLETPRKGGEALLKKGIEGRWAMQGTTRNQIYESEVTSGMIPREENVLIGGDFNLPTNNPIYKANWRGYQNAFEKVGKGFGWTRFTRIHGVRIDHILTDPSWTVLSAEIGPDLGGDHRPVFVVVEKQVDPDQMARAAGGSVPDPRPDKVILPPAEDIFIYEDFEDTDVKIDLTTWMNRSIHFKQSQGKALKLETGQLTIREGSIKLPPEPFDVYPKLSMAYQMLPAQPLYLRAKTQLGEWICLGATPGAECEHPAIKNFRTLHNDGEWHQFDMDVIGEIQTLLRANKSIQELELVIPTHEANLNKIWLDDILIYK